MAGILLVEDEKELREMLKIALIGINMLFLRLLTEEKLLLTSSLLLPI